MRPELARLIPLAKAVELLESLETEMRVLTLHETLADPQRVLKEVEAVKKEIAKARTEISKKYE